MRRSGNQRGIAFFPEKKEYFAQLLLVEKARQSALDRLSYVHTYV